MSFEVIAPGNYENRQSEDAKQRRTDVPSGPPPATISVQNISEKMDEPGDEWVQLSESGPEHAHAPVHVPMPKVYGPYLRTDPRFTEFVNQVLSEPADGGDDIVKDNLLRMCGDSLLEYVRDKNYGLFNKVSQDKSMTPEKRQEFADNASEADGETDQYALVVSKTEKRENIVGFLLAREISSTDVSEVRVYVDLVCRDKNDQRATGISMFQRLREHYEKYARRSKRLIFILDAVESAIPRYEGWGFSSILNKINKKPSTNAHNHAFPMMMGLTNKDGKWEPDKRPEDSYVFVNTVKELKDSGDYENCDVLVCDHMWLLFKFHPDEGAATGEDLVDFIWRPMLRFFRAGGSSYACVFDVPERVPVAKAEEHKKRYGSGPRPDKPTGTCSPSSLPLPWHAALADRRARGDVCAYIARGIVARFESHADELKDKELVVSGVGGEVVRADAKGSRVWKEHAAVAEVGEGDLAVAYWVNHFADRSVVARVLDTDQIPILMLRAKLSRRVAPLHVWLVSPKTGGSDERSHGYECIPPEGHTLVDVLGLNDEMERTTRASVEEWVFWIIAQKTDFVDKIVQNLGVAPTLAALEEDAARPPASTGASAVRTMFGRRGESTSNPRQPIVRVTASRATCDSREMSIRFGSAIASAKRKRATIREDADVEFRRAWWTLLYWSYGWDGPLRESLRPRPAFGFDERGMRAKANEDVSFPDYVSSD